MISKLFPFLLYLHIFQLEEYNVSKFVAWLKTHYATRKTDNKKPLVWTQKVKLLFVVAVTLCAAVLMILSILFHLRGFIIGILLATQSYLFVLSAYFVLLPLEKSQKKTIIAQTKQKMSKLTHVKVIGVTGSYGKTSVKDFLYQILKTKYKVLKTPESYNTPFGIAKVIKYELTNAYDYFICEMGAYRQGDIKEICDLVSPTYGVLTGINEQHLESFGSLENTTKGKFELIDALPDTGFGVINLDNKRIQTHANTYQKKLIGYGFTDSTFSVKNIKTETHGTAFSLVLKGKKYEAFTKLIGMPNIQNILGAATMSYSLGMSAEEIVTAIATIKPVPHRLEIKERDNMILIDNAYNSNVDGFKASIALLQQFSNPKIFVTPGIVDLGKETYPLHKTLGKLMTHLDAIILVGDSERTKGLYEGIENKNKIIQVNKLSEVWDELRKLGYNHPVVLLENDLPDNY